MEIVPEASLAMTVVDFANMDNPITVWITEQMFDESYFREKELNNRFSSLGFANRDIMNNQADFFPIMLLTVLIYLGIFALFSLIVVTKLKRPQFFVRFIRKVYNALFFNYLIRAAFELYLILTITASINLFYQVELDTIPRKFSYILSLLYYGFVQLAMVGTFVMIIKHQSGIIEDRDSSKYSRWNAAFEDLKNQRTA